MYLVGRLLIGAFALLLAIPCGAAVLATGVLLDPATSEALSRLGLVGFFGGLSDLAEGIPPEVAFMALLAFAQALFVLLVLPPTLTAILGEAFGLRALAWYGGASGLFTALLPWLARGGIRPPSGPAALAAEGRIAAILLLAGAASGLVYWLVAGRGAGRRATPAP
ncbi:hypothetical protein MMB17_22360 [Methylobacterium organophilum]|uniref:hypothetical protein n=1 Tax=Methylobacterium organophilum TaxID=410 RepID=UPI001F135127|nr:hypothetical protein [Methylobacterium organophilum]UMY17332.1 hypothetical protein MMB17_22360 [Methylobacterium organophilum]